jgi:hypothetical protein
MFFQSEWLTLLTLFSLYLHRAVVRIGIRGTIVAIEVAHAGIVAIVSVAQTNSTTQSAGEGSASFSSEKRCKDTNFYCYQQVKERELLLIYTFLNNERASRRSAMRAAFSGR